MINHRHYFISFYFLSFSYPDLKSLQALGPKRVQQADLCPLNIEPFISCISDPPVWLTNSKSFVIEEAFGESSKCFNSNFGRPLCLKSYCDREQCIIWVKFGNDEFKCSYDDEVINVEIAGNKVKIECPKRAVLCPDMICPSNCNGTGKCNWELPIPQCESFRSKSTKENDPEDDSNNFTIPYYPYLEPFPINGSIVFDGEDVLAPEESDKEVLNETEWSSDPIVYDDDFLTR